MKAKYLVAPILVGAMALAACSTDPFYYSPELRPTTEPTSIVQPAPTAIPTVIPTPTTGPQVSPTPYAAFSDLNAIFYSDLIPNPPVFQPGETPWTPDQNVYVLEIFDDGQTNSAVVCNIPNGAADDGVVNLSDYPPGDLTTISQCYGGASRASQGYSSGPTFYVIRKDGNRGTVLDVELDSDISYGMNIANVAPAFLTSLMPDCAAGVCTDEPNAYVLEGSLSPVAAASDPIVVAQASP